MKHLRTYAIWGLAVLALLLGPIVVILGVPLALGIGLDILDLAGGRLVALALCVPVAFVLSRRVSPRALVHRLADSLVRRQQELDHSASWRPS